MQKAKINKSFGNQRNEITAGRGIRMRKIPARNNRQENLLRNERVTGRLIASMDLEEMLEASRIAELQLSGQTVPRVKSPKVQQYVKMVFRLCRIDTTKLAAKKMQQNLSAEIVKRNKRTTNEKEAKFLYNSLMDEE